MTTGRHDEIEREWSYQMGWLVLVAVLAFFGGGGVFLAYLAMNNDAGLVINRVIELSPSGAAIFYWVLAAVCFAFVILALALAVLRFSLEQRVAVTPTALLLPRRRWSSEEIAIPYDEIEALTFRTVEKERFLEFRHRGRKRTIAASMLPSPAVLDELAELLGERVETGRPLS